MQFEIIFITEGHESTPAAEIQFSGQRLCIVRVAPPNTPQIQFLQDLYVGKSAEMIFPLADFQTTLQTAVNDLTAWLQDLAGRGSEA